jgi:uncharacterized protein YbaR (Trm112 family)
MPLDPELKKILACPRCKGELKFLEDVHQIHCLACKLAYAIEDDVPVMLVEEAKPLSPAP